MQDVPGKQKQQHGFLPFNTEWRKKTLSVQLERDNQNFVKHYFIYISVGNLKAKFIFHVHAMSLTYLAWRENLGISL